MQIQTWIATSEYSLTETVHSLDLLITKVLNESCALGPYPNTHLAMTIQKKLPVGSFLFPIFLTTVEPFLSQYHIATLWLRDFEKFFKRKQVIFSPVICLLYLLLHCGAFLAFFKPNFLLSFAL
jgi:hypothetical protein